MILVQLFDTVSHLATAFQGLFLEGIFWLLAGCVVSGLMAVFAGQSDLDAGLLQHKWLAPVLGSLIGLAVPVGSAGSIPVARRLVRQCGSTAMIAAFVVAAPAVSLPVLVTTYQALGAGVEFYSRFGLTVAAAVGFGLITSLSSSPGEIFRLQPASADAHNDPAEGFRQKIHAAIREASLDFTGLAPLFILACGIGAVAISLVPRGLFVYPAVRAAYTPLAAVLPAFLMPSSPLLDAFTVLSLPAVYRGAGSIVFMVLGAAADLPRIVMMTSIFTRKGLVTVSVLMVSMTVAASTLLNVLLIR